MRGSVSEVMRCLARCGGRRMSVFGRSILRIITAWSTFAAIAGRWATSQAASAARHGRRRARDDQLAPPRAQRAGGVDERLQPVVGDLDGLARGPRSASARPRERGVDAPPQLAGLGTSVPCTSIWWTTSSSRCSRNASDPVRTARRDCEVNMRFVRCGAGRRARSVFPRREPVKPASGTAQPTSDPVNGSVPLASGRAGRRGRACRRARAGRRRRWRPAIGASWSVLRHAERRPVASMKPLPESPGMPGVTV